MRRNRAETPLLAAGGVRPAEKLRASPGPVQLLVSAVCWSIAVGAHAQSGTPQRTLTLLPSASLSQTYTSTYLLSDVDPAADAIARATATLALTANGGYLKGFLDYSLSSLIYFRHSDKNSIQNALNARMTAELVPGRGFVDVAANISRSAISAFGNQPGGGASVQDNVTELRTLRVAPRFAGPLGPDLRYSANLALSATDAKDTTQGFTIGLIASF